MTGTLNAKWGTIQHTGPRGQEPWTASDPSDGSGNWPFSHTCKLEAISRDLAVGLAVPTWPPETK
jgi:hypothetical protein